MSFWSIKMILSIWISNFVFRFPSYFFRHSCGLPPDGPLPIFQFLITRLFHIASPYLHTLWDHPLVSFPAQLQALVRLYPKVIWKEAYKAGSGSTPNQKHVVWPQCGIHPWICMYVCTCTHQGDSAWATAASPWVPPRHHWVSGWVGLIGWWQSHSWLV